MSVTTSPGKGVIINLNEYARLQISRTGPDFWYINNQSILCDKLAPFLPRMNYDPSSNTVTAQRIERGKERLGDSIAANPDFSNVPADQVRQLREVISKFQQEIEDLPKSDAFRRLGDAFTLPIPSKAPELYRLYGTGKNKKLVIIWGVSKTDSSGNEDTSSVASLQQMLRELPNPRKENPVLLFITNTIEIICKLPRPVQLALLGILVVLIALLSWMSSGSDSEGAIPPQTPGQTIIGTQPVGQPTISTQPARQTTISTQQPARQTTIGTPPAGQPTITLSVGNMPCQISVKHSKQVGKQIHITFNVTPLNGQMPHKVYIDRQEVKGSAITLAYNTPPKTIKVSVIPTEGAAPINAELPFSKN